MTERTSRLAAIATTVAALAGAFTALQQCSERAAGPAVQLAVPPPVAAPWAVPAPVPIPSPSAAIASCCDLLGVPRCLLPPGGLPGTPCFCPGQGAGFVCP